MLIASVAAGPLAANCYVLAREEGTDCVIIDPGMDAAEPIDAVLEEHRLSPAAILLTHGHFDHLADAAAVVGRYRTSWWIHPADRDWLEDPYAALTPDFHPLVEDYLDRRQPQPELDGEAELDVELGHSVELAGICIAFLPAPGHTPGSTLFRTAIDGRDVVFSGDVLFEGTIGRCDLPGGDPVTMERTLSSTVLSLPDQAVVLPGHGRQTTIGRERRSNPFLHRLDPPST